MKPSTTAQLALALALQPTMLAAQVKPVARPMLPAHPNQLRFQPIRYDPPRAQDHRVLLPSGMVVYVAEDSALPLVNLSIVLRTGAYLDPPGQQGLAALTGSQLRRGGTRRLTAEALDERLDFLAAQVQTGIGDTAGTASLNCLSDNFDESLALFVEILKQPAFQADRLALAKQQTLQELTKRNDESEDIEAREWDLLSKGPDHFSNRFVTGASLEAIQRQDLIDFHRRYFHPANMIVAVSGAFERTALLKQLEAAFANWPGAKPEVEAVPTTLGRVAAAGLYRVTKDVNQGRVSIGLPGVRRNHPDIYALEVMNEILGGSGFTSRITKKVRSDEGLAYSAGSQIGFGPFYPGRFRAAFQSKSRSVARATQLVLAEIASIRATPVSAQELDTIKRNLIETFPTYFSSKMLAMNTFAQDEYAGRASDFWVLYRERIAKVSAADVQRVAREHLVPERLIVLVVGDPKEIDLGDPKQPVTLKELAPGGHVEQLPLRDPVTLEALP